MITYKILLASGAFLVVALVSACATTAGPTPTPVSPAATSPAATATPVPVGSGSTPTPEAPAATPTGAWIALSPDNGAPGASIQINGYLPGGPTAASAKGNQALLQGTVCWAGCLTGLTEQTVPVAWSDSEAGRFSMQFVVPAVPWLGADGPQPLVPGDYAIGIQCVGPAIQGCALQEAQASATFHLSGPTPALCVSQPCAQLELKPAQAQPGTLIQVQGWAPLVEIADTPFGYSLVLQQAGSTANPSEIGQIQQSPSGDLSGAFRVPLAAPSLGILGAGPYAIALETIRSGVSPTTTLTAPGVTISPLPNGGERITLAATSFTLVEAPTWTSLGQVRPLWTQISARLFSPPAVAVDESNLLRIAYCAPGNIQLSTDAGATWSAISTSGAVTVAAATQYPLFNGGGASAPTCDTVVLDPRNQRSFYATFDAVQKPYGAPPTFRVGLVTTDSGNTWKFVPTPPDYQMQQFGGFRVHGEGVQALYAGTASKPGQAPPFAVVETVDGGQTWKPSDLTCPTVGPCVRWGPAPSEIGSMGPSYPQSIEISTDSGHTWETPVWPSQVILNGGPSELVALSGSQVALLSWSDDYPFRLSEDSGQTWMVITLPALPGGGGGGPLYPGLQMLPDGSLLARSQDGSGWYMLAAGGSAWCTVAGPALPPSPDVLTGAGDWLWWLQASDTSNLRPIPHNVLPSELHCTS